MKSLILTIALLTPLFTQAHDLPKIEILAEGFQFTEGPTLHPTTGQVYFTDIPNQRIHIWDPKTNQVTLFRENSGHANGLLFMKNGLLLVCEGGNRTVSSITAQKKRSILTSLTQEPDGKKLNSPNDLWLHPNGRLYFTDPRYGKRDDMELDTEQVYYLPKGPSNAIRVTTDLTRPNGIIGTPDGITLYISDQGDNKTYQYRIKEDGTLENKTLFADQGSDGMTLDSKGKLYLTHQNLDIFSPDGKKLHSIELPATPSNVTLLSETKEHTTLFVTARQYILKVTISH